MEDNNCIELGDKTQEKKKFRILTFLLAFVPLVMALIIQTLTTVPFAFKAVFSVMGSSPNNDLSGDELMEGVREKLLGYNIYIMIIYAVIAFVVFFLWYRSAFIKKGKISFFKSFSVKSVIMVLMMALGTYAFVALILASISCFFPDIMENYNELIETSGLTDNSVLTFVCVIVIGPIVEELVFRGLSYGYLRKSGLSAIPAIIIQALLFGLFHMNLVQGLYATVLGIAIGYVRYKFDSVSLGVLFHMLFNIFDSFSGGQLQNVDEMYQVIIFIVCGFIGVAGICLIICDRAPVKAKADKTEEVS